MIGQLSVTGFYLTKKYYTVMCFVPSIRASEVKALLARFQVATRFMTNVWLSVFGDEVSRPGMRDSAVG